MASFSRGALRLAKDRAILRLLPRRRSLSYPREPLTQPVSDLPPSVPSSSSASSHAQQRRDHIERASLAETRVTELENGLRVASQEAFGQYSTIGGEYFVNGCCWCALIRPHLYRPAVLVDAGSRYEVDYTSGVSHFIHRLAFQVERG